MDAGRADRPPKTRLARQNDHCLESPAGDGRQRRRVRRHVGARHVGRRRRPSQRSRRATSLRRRRLSTLLDDDVSDEISLDCANYRPSDVSRCVARHAPVTRRDQRDVCRRVARAEQNSARSTNHNGLSVDRPATKSLHLGSQTRSLKECANDRP